MRNAEVASVPPVVSIIIPSYKRPSETRRAVESALRQDYRPVEIIVVDDNGAASEYAILTERALSDLIESGAIVYIRHATNRGGNAARNSGVRASTGEFISFLDSDDEFRSNKTRMQVEAIEGAPEDSRIVAAVCNTAIHMGGKYQEESQDSGQIRSGADVLRGRYKLGFGSSLIFRRRCIEDIGLFDERLVRHQEIDFILRLLSAYRIHIVEDVLVDRHADDRSNVPATKKFIENKTYFLQKHIGTTVVGSDDEMRHVRDVQNLEICKVAMWNGDYALAARYLLKSRPGLSLYGNFLLQVLRGIRRYAFR